MSDEWGQRSEYYDDGERFGSGPEMISEIKRLRALLAEIERRVVFESVGMGNTFSDSVECYLQHGGKCPTVEEAYEGALHCDLHRA